MAGRYRKAPLVYVVASFRVNEIPALTTDQEALLQQGMMKLGLRRVLSENPQFEIDLSNKQGLLQSTQKRVGFFSEDQTEALIFGGSFIEWRVTKYSKYDGFISGFKKTLASVIEAVDSLGYMEAQEFVLSYSDIIIPKQNRTLSDYFAKSDSILPLSFLGENNDLQRVGAVQVTRVINLNQKITISVEQLPVVGGQINKFIPDQMGEPDQKFQMPLNITADWQISERGDYAIMATQAAKLTKIKVKDLSVVDAYSDLKKLTSETFKELINRSVCDEDWEFNDE